MQLMKGPFILRRLRSSRLEGSRANKHVILLFLPRSSRWVLRTPLRVRVPEALTRGEMR
jgi:hypothetical protein